MKSRKFYVYRIEEYKPTTEIIICEFHKKKNSLKKFTQYNTTLIAEFKSEDWRKCRLCVQEDDLYSNDLYEDPEVEKDWEEYMRNSNKEMN